MASCDHSQRSFDLGARQIEVATSLPIGEAQLIIVDCLNLRRSAEEFICGFDLSR
jgi:hypothetical protein